eukprot:m.92044 g.92044  ORF g.92044 m.92044 type:complete len:277 (+) comp8499_c0_seq1:185-1015(+)
MQAAARTAERLVEDKARELEARVHEARAGEWETQRTLQAQRAALETEVAGLKARLQQKDSELAATAAQIEQLRATPRVEPRRTERAAPTAELAQLRERAAMLEQERGRLHAETTALQTSVRELRRDVRTHQDAAERAAAQLNATTADMRDVQAEIDRLRDQHARDIADLTRAKLDETRIAVETASTHHGAEAQELARRLQQLTDKLAAKKRRYRDERERAQQDVEARDARIAELEAELTRMRGSLSELQRRVDCFRVTLFDGSKIVSCVPPTPCTC